MKLNLGCGGDKKQGYVNIDIRKEVKPDMVLDLEKTPYPFDDNSIDEILAKDVIEHFSFRNVERVVKEWHRILKPGGKLVIQTPDFDVIVDLIRKGEIKGWWQISYWLYGGQDYPENTHKLIFTKEEIRKFLESLGFSIRGINSGGTNMIVEAYKKGGE